MVTGVVLLHISPAIIAIISGGLAMVFRKGSSLHRVSGTFFCVAMLLMSGSAVFFALFYKPNLINAVAGLLAFYLTATGWWAARRRDGTSLFDIVALAGIAAVAASAVVFGIEAANSATGMFVGGPAAGYFIFASISLLFAASDVRMLVRGGVSGAQRIARHVWRMCLTLLFVTASLYPGQGRLFPKAWHTSLMYVPHVLLAGSMILWMVRLRRLAPARRGAAVETADVVMERKVA